MKGLIETMQFAVTPEIGAIESIEPETVFLGVMGEYMTSKGIKYRQLMATQLIEEEKLFFVRNFSQFSPDEKSSWLQEALIAWVDEETNIAYRALVEEDSEEIDEMDFLEGEKTDWVKVLAIVLVLIAAFLAAAGAAIIVINRVQ